jgi:hypothetical protein
MTTLSADGFSAADTSIPVSQVNQKKVRELKEKNYRD